MLALGEKIVWQLNSASDNSYAEYNSKFSLKYTEGGRVEITLAGHEYPNVLLSGDVDHIIVGKNTIVPIIHASIIVDVDKETKDFVDDMRDFVASEFKRNDTFKNPWHFKDHSRYTVDRIKIGEMPSYEEPQQSSSSSKYDPKQAYQDRMTPAAKSRQHAISNHQFRNSIGGDSSNYR